MIYYCVGLCELIFSSSHQIFDGPNVHAYPLGVFCGLIRPQPVRSSGSTMTLEFKSDFVIGGRGFLVEWTAVQSSGPLPTIAPGVMKNKRENIPAP